MIRNIYLQRSYMTFSHQSEGPNQAIMTFPPPAPKAQPLARPCNSRLVLGGLPPPPHPHPTTDNEGIGKVMPSFK
jgi:hypothetical protein